MQTAYFLPHNRLFVLICYSQIISEHKKCESLLQKSLGRCKEVSQRCQTWISRGRPPQVIKQEISMRKDPSNQYSKIISINHTSLDGIQQSRLFGKKITEKKKYNKHRRRCQDCRLLSDLTGFLQRSGEAGCG